MTGDEVRAADEGKMAMAMAMAVCQNNDQGSGDCRSVPRWKVAHPRWRADVYVLNCDRHVAWYHWNPPRTEQWIIAEVSNDQ